MVTDSEIAIEWIEKCKEYKNNIVINNCEICNKIFIQKWPYQICKECEEMQNVF